MGEKKTRSIKKHEKKNLNEKRKKKTTCFDSRAQDFSNLEKALMDGSMQRSSS